MKNEKYKITSKQLANEKRNLENITDLKDPRGNLIKSLKKIEDGEYGLAGMLLSDHKRKMTEYQHESKGAKKLAKRAENTILESIKDNSDKAEKIFERFDLEVEQ